MKTTKIACMAIILALFSGCRCNHSFNLDKKWEPLKYICESSDKFFEPNFVTTYGDTVYTPDIVQFFKDYPLNSVKFEAVLKHERRHSLDQGSFLGPAEIFLARIATDSAFRWKEEQAGYREEIRWLVAHGASINVDALAKILSEGYISLGQPMCSFDEAKAWVHKTVSEAQLDIFNILKDG